MTYFPDPTDYVYADATFARPGTQNVGWLGENEPFETGEVGEEILESLWQHCRLSFVQTRGLHECHLCQSDEANVAERNGQKLLLGSAEIRVFSESRRIYAAPNLIYHYVSVHKYRPPEEFIGALRDGLRPFSERYANRVSELGLACDPTLVPDGRPRRIRFVASK